MAPITLPSCPNTGAPTHSMCSSSSLASKAYPFSQMCIRDRDKAAAKNIPVFGSEIEQVKIGCLAAMGLDYIELGKQTGRMAAQVLRGEKKASEMNYETIKEAAFFGNTQVAGNRGITLPEDLTKKAAGLFTEIAQ